MSTIALIEKAIKRYETIALIEKAIKTYARGLITEGECIESIKEILAGDHCPVLDVFGLGAGRDPEAYGLPRRD